MAKSDNIETRYLKQDEYSIWDSFVDESRDGTLFHKTGWLQSIALWQKLSFSIVACFKGGKITGGMAFTWKKKFGRIPVIQMPLKTPFFGPVIAYSDTKYQSRIESQVQLVVKALTGFLLSEYHLFHAQFPPTLTDVRPYAWNGFKTGIHYTYKTALTQEFDISAIVESDIKRRTNKASQLDFDLIEDNSEKYIGQAWDLEQKSFESKDFQLHGADRDSFISFIRGLSGENAAQVFTIIYDNKPASSIVMITDQAKKVAYYWMAGADRQFLSTGLNQLLLMEVINKYHSQGFSAFDLVGADTESIARYKSTFNLPLVPTYSVQMAKGITRLALRVKEILR